MDFGALIQQVEKVYQVFTDKAAIAINRNLTARNWLTGFYIVNYEQNGIDDNLLIQKYWLSLPKESLLTDWLKKEVAKYGGRK